MTSAPLDDPPALPSVTRVDRGSWSLVTTLARHEYRAAVLEFLYQKQQRPAA